MDDCFVSYLIMSIFFSLSFLGFIAALHGYHSLRGEAVQRGYARYNSDGKWEWRL